MARPSTCRNAGRAPTNDSGTSFPIPVVYRAPTPAAAQTPITTKASTPTQAPTPASASASAPGQLRRYTNKDLQRATKLALKLFVKGQEYGQLQANSAPCKQPLKARFSNLYYRNFHLNCYRFCLQCEHYFETAWANGPNQVFFAALFLHRAMV